MFQEIETDKGQVKHKQREEAFWQTNVRQQVHCSQAPVALSPADKAATRFEGRRVSSKNERAHEMSVDKSKSQLTRFTERIVCTQNETWGRLSFRDSVGSRGLSRGRVPRGGARRDRAQVEQGPRVAYIIVLPTRHLTDCPGPLLRRIEKPNSVKIWDWMKRLQQKKGEGNGTFIQRFLFAFQSGELITTFKMLPMQISSKGCHSSFKNWSQSAIICRNLTQLRVVYFRCHGFEFISGRLFAILLWRCIVNITWRSTDPVTRGVHLTRSQSR